MRLAVLLLVLLGATADAKRLVIREPPMVRKCAKGKTWDLVTACLKKHSNSTPVTIKTLGAARLVTITQRGSRYAGFYLYVPRNGEYQIAGNIESWGQYQVLALDYQKVGRHTGYRIDVGQDQPTTVMLDDTTQVAAQLRVTKSFYCSGQGYDCAEAIRTCEIRVNGRPRFIFRGTFEIDPQGVTIKGDRSRAGPMCAPQPKVYLGWPSG